MNDFKNSSDHQDLSRLEETLPMEQAEFQDLKPSTGKPRRPWWKWLLILFSSGILFFLLLLATAGIYLTYYFPTEKIKPLAETELTRILKIPVSIDSLDLSLLHGLNISRLTLGKEELLFTVKDITLDYDLTQILQGHLVINKAVVDEPQLNLVSEGGVWNFQPLLDLAKPAENAEPEPVEEKPPGLPALPIAVDLREFGIRNIQVSLDIDGETKSRLQGLSVEARGKIDQDEIDVWLQSTLVPPAKGEHNLEFSSSQGNGVDIKTLALMNVEVNTQDLNHIGLTGKLGLKKNQFQIGDSLPSPDLSTEIKLTASVQDMAVDIEKLALFLTEENRIELSGEADQLDSSPRFLIRLNEAAFNIEDIIQWAGSMIPPVEAGGKILVTGLEVKGNLPDFKPGDIEVKDTRINVKGFFAKHPPLSAVLEGADAQIHLVHASLKNGVPENLQGSVRLKLDRVRAQDITLEGLEQDLEIRAQGSSLNEVALTFSTALKEVGFSSPETGAIKTPLNLKGFAEANLGSGDVEAFGVDYSLGQTAVGELKGRARNFGKTSFQVEHDIDIGLKALRGMMPEKLLQKIDGFPSAGKTRVYAMIQGRLDESFQPVQALVNTEINLEGINARLQNPPVKAEQVFATISFPLDYIPEKGIKIPRLLVSSRFQKVEALGNLELGASEMITRLTMGDYYPLSGDAGKIPVTNKTSIQLGRVHSTSPEVTLTGLKLETYLTSDLYPKDFRNLALKGDITIAGVEGLQEVQAGKIQTSFEVHVNDLSLTKTTASVDIQVDPPPAEKLAGKIPIGPITFAGRTRQNLKSGDIEIDRVSLQAPSLINLGLKGKLKDWGKTFTVESKIQDTQLAAVWAKLPTAFKAGMEDLKVQGAMEATLSATGRIPEKIELGKTPLPIVAKAGIQLNGGSVSWPSKGISVDRLNTSSVVDIKDGNGMVSGQLKLDKLFYKDLLGEDWVNPEFGFKYFLNDFNKFLVEQHTFSIKKIGIDHSITGNVDGLKPFLTGKIPWRPDELSRRLDVSLAIKNQLDFKKALTLGSEELLKGIQANGALLSRLDLKMVSGETIEADGNVEFDRFNAEVPGVVKVTELNGRFPFNKRLFLERVLVKTLPESFLASRKGFFTQLRNFSNNKNNLTVKEVVVANQRISNISLDLLFKNNQILAEKFLFDVLDGSVAGNLFFIPTPKGPQLNFSTEFAGLNFGALTGRSKRAEKSESEIDGNMQLGVKLKQGLKSEPISLDQINTKFAITRIGAETLDRFLLFIDPEESKPAIVDTRAKLKLASPHRILVTVENGNLNVEAWLKNKILGDILKAPELKRVPITSLKQFRDMADPLKSLTGLKEALQYLAARGMEFDENGDIVLY